VGVDLFDFKWLVRLASLELTSDHDGIARCRVSEGA